MNILIISPGVFPIPALKGGAVEKLIEMLIKSDKITQKHNITVYTVYDTNIEDEASKIHCDFEYIKTKRMSYQIKRVIRHILNRFCHKYIGNQYIYEVKKSIEKNKKKYDIIIIENEPQYGLIINKVKKNAKMILHLHNDYLNKDVVNAKKIYDVYDKIWTISSFIRERVNKIGKDFKKVKTFYNGVDIERFNFNAKEMLKTREKYDLPKEDFIFMYVGRLAKEKGIGELVEAFKELHNENAKLLIIGGKQNGQERFYKNLKKEISKNQNIIYVGYVNYNESNKIYGIADVGIVPSICNEAFGLTLVEFMSLGKPVIISDRGALPEIAGIEKNTRVAVYNKNYVDNLKNEMKYFLNLKSENFINIKQQSINRAKKFTKEIYVENFLTLIEEEKNEKK